MKQILKQKLVNILSLSLLILLISFTISLSYGNPTGSNQNINDLEHFTAESEKTFTPSELQIWNALQHAFNKESFSKATNKYIKISSNIYISNSLSSDSEIKINFLPKQTHITLLLSERAAKNPALVLGELIVFSSLADFNATIIQTNLAGLLSVFEYKELLYNLQHGSSSAKARILDYQIQLLRSTKFHGILSFLNNEADKLLIKLIDELPPLIKTANKYQRKNEKELIKKRKESNQLETYEAMDLKLNHLVLANDRKGVRKMIEAYLPWVIMEPAEIQFWKTWLDAIEFPDLKNTIVAFRGLDYKYDKIQRDAMGNIALLSTVLTANQGSYTRRLRSLSTNRIKNGNPIFNPVAVRFQNINSLLSKQLISPLITKQFRKHAGNPDASSFLSFSLLPNIASGFSSGSIKVQKDDKTTEKVMGGMVAVQIDKRRIFPNLTSHYDGERELLVPLIVFPDEIIAFEEGEKAKNNSFKNLLQTVKEKTGILYSEMNLNNKTIDFINEKYNTKGFQFFKKSFSNLKIKYPACKNLFL